MTQEVVNKEPLITDISTQYMLIANYPHLHDVCTQMNN